ncbi:MAG: CRISPR-associated endonuclease Cas2 [bacterium JZ-2024 1]
MFVVISYDIKDDKRRNRVFKALKDYGQWVQFSVFECHLHESHYLRLRNKLERLIRKDQNDSIRFYFLCEKDQQKIERIGGTQPLPEGAIVI